MEKADLRNHFLLLHKPIFPRWRHNMLYLAQYNVQCMEGPLWIAQALNMSLFQHVADMFKRRCHLRVCCQYTRCEQAGIVCISFQVSLSKNFWKRWNKKEALRLYSFFHCQFNTCLHEFYNEVVRIIYPISPFLLQ